MASVLQTTLEADVAVLGGCADATRLRILFLLAVRELCVCELVEILRMPQGKVSRHLTVLRNAGLVRPRREGTWMHYSLAPATSALARRLSAYLREAPCEVAAADRQRLGCLASGRTACCDLAGGRRSPGDHLRTGGR